MTNYAIGGLAPAFYPLSIEFGKTMTETSNLLLWPILVLGLFNFWWVPLANYFGKRLIFVFCSLLLCLSYLWGALAKSFDSLLWSNIIAAFAGSASEALAASIVNDIFFLHERAGLMGWYQNAICGGNTIGPLICGFVITHSTWRVHKWHAFGLMAINFLTVVLFVPETSYQRSFNEDSETRRASSGLSPTASGSDQGAGDYEKGLPTVMTALPSAFHPEPVMVQKKSQLQNMKLWSGLPKEKTLIKLFLRPIPLVAYPAVIFAFLGWAASLSWVVAINVLNSFVLQAHPYSWRPEINGLINIPGLLGNLFGAWIGGGVVDRYSDWQSKRHDGVFQPEYRLHLLIVPAIIVPVGCLAFGYGVDNHLHWTAL